MAKSPEGLPTPEDQAKIQKSRTLSDAELIKGGADYVPNAKGEPRLEVTPGQIKSAEKEMSVEEKIQTMLPVGEEFPVYFKPNKDSQRGLGQPQHEALFKVRYDRLGGKVPYDVPMGKVEAPSAENPNWILSMEGKRYKITNIDTGIGGSCVTIAGEDEKPQYEFEKKVYFYTGVSSEDKTKRTTTKDFPFEYS